MTMHSEAQANEPRPAPDAVASAQAVLPTYTVATLVNDRAQYAAMCASFRAHGFDEACCEMIAAFNPPSAYSALNELLSRAKGQYVIICHQDVRLIGDDRARLDQRLAELDALDSSWAVAGNAGGALPGKLAMRISDPHGEDRTMGTLPARVVSLDENFLVVKAASRVAFSRDLDGFHLYGADICLVADVLGYSAYVIDFHLRHLSPGRKDATFTKAEAAFRTKWSRALKPRWMQTTCTLLRIGGVAGTGAPSGLLSRAYAGILRRTVTSDSVVPKRIARRSGT